MNIISVITTVAAISLASGAQAHTLTIENLTAFDIVHAWVKTGQIHDFKRVKWGSHRSFEVTLPPGQCDTKLTVTFDSGQTLSTDAELCGGMELKITRR